MDPAPPPRQAPTGPQLARYEEWLRGTGARLYRHDIDLDFSLLTHQVGARLGMSLEGVQIQDAVSHVYRVVATATVELLRQAQSQNTQPPAGALPLDPQVLSKVGGVVAALPAEHRDVVGLYLQGFTRQEMVDLTGWNEEASRQGMQAANENLRQWLETDWAARMQLTERELREAYRRLTAHPGQDRQGCFPVSDLVELPVSPDSALPPQSLSHLVACSDCARELQLTTSLQEWSETAAIDLLPRRWLPGPAGGLVGRFLQATADAWSRSSIFLRVALGVLFLLFLAGSVASWVLLRENGRLRDQLAAAEESRGEASAVDPTLDQVNASLASLRAQNAQRQQIIGDLRRQVVDLSRPFPNHPIIELNLRRVQPRDGTLPRQSVAVPAEAPWFTLNVTLSRAARTAGYTDFALELVDASTETVWEGAGLEDRGRSTFVLSFPTQLVGRGIYHLRFYGLGDGDRQLVEQFSIEVTNP